MGSYLLNIIYPSVFIVFLFLILKKYIIENWGFGLLILVVLDFLSKLEISTSSLIVVLVVFETILFLSQTHFRNNIIHVFSSSKTDVGLKTKTSKRFKVVLEKKRSLIKPKRRNREIIANNFAPELRNCTVCPARFEPVNTREISTEANRLATFSAISLSSIPSQCPYFTHLTKSGFFYDRHEYRIRCSRCTSTFDLNNVPVDRRDWHVQWCTYAIAGHHLTTRGNEVTRDRPEENDMDVDVVRLDLREAFKTYGARFNSITGRPWAVEPNTAHTLALFGMYYGDISDQLFCHACNFMIIGWSEGRTVVDIREHHSQFNPGCTSLRNARQPGVAV